MNRKTILIIALALVIVVGVSIAYSLYNAPHRQVSNEAPAMQIQATELYKAYAADEAHANSLYLDKVLQVNGVVKEITDNEQGGKVLILETAEMFGINCSMENSQTKELSAIKKGAPVTIKGICNGMLMDVVLVKCVLINEGL